MSLPAPDRAQRALDRTTGVLGGALVVVSVVFLLTPAVLIAVLSFAADSRVLFPPRTWGFDRYVDVFTSGNWDRPLLLSLEIASWVALLAVLIAVPMVFALKRSRLPGRGLLEGIAIAPLVIPVSAYAVGLYAVFAQLDLLGSKFGIVLAHTVHALPLVVILLSTSLEQLKPDLELAAMTMGASRGRAWLGITLRLLVPSIVAALLFGFISSFDEAVLITFLGGAGLVTLPKYIFDSVQYAIDPAITAIATLLMLATTAIMLLATSLRKEPR
ncbi:ABC transporter permease [Microbacterium sp. NPDC096154]|uniref:ABC transporter permease n=1 Tax=Microbacterium sp. NPDC096154 TaxID=3155549 RepID=UPI00332F8ED8